jgi:hypothetical protein
MAELSDVIGDWSLGSIQSGIYSYVPYLIWGLVGVGVLIFAWVTYQNKKIYIYPVRIHRQRNNGMVKEINTSGGYVKKGNITQFVIKIGRFKKKPAEKLPLSEYMDEDNRVYYWQVSPESPLIQVKRDFIVEPVLVPNEHFMEPTKEHRDLIIKKWTNDLLLNEEFKDATEEERKIKAEELFDEQVEIERGKLIDVTHPTYSPVPTDLKQQAIMDINSYKTALGVDVNKQFAYFIIGVIALVIVGTIIFYIAINKGDIPILTK